MKSPEIRSKRRQVRLKLGVALIVITIVVSWYILATPSIAIPIWLTLHGDVVDPKMKSNHDLNMAQALWESQHLTHYRMLLEYKYKQYREPAGTCHEEIEIRDNQVVAVNTTPVATPCRPNIPTVASLFQQIQHDINVVRWNQCNVLIVTTTYNAQIGYPKYIKYEWESASPENLGIDDFSAQARQCEDDAMFPPDVDDIAIESLSPLNP